MKKNIMRFFTLVFAFTFVFPYTFIQINSSTDTTSEQILYQNDFSSDSLSDFTVVQQTSGSTISISDGKLILNASADKNNYIRVLLPETLSQYSNFRIEINATAENPIDTTKWMSIMFNVQNNDYPYSQFTIRQNATASNGTEYGEKNASNAWNIFTTIPYNSAITAGTYYNMTIQVFNNQICTFINDTLLTNTTLQNSYTNGRMGLQVRGITAKIDSIKITATTTTYVPPTSYLNDVAISSDNIILPPSVVSYIDTSDDYNNLSENKPTTAIFHLNDNGEIVGTDDVKIASINEAIAKLNKETIPAYYIKTEAMAAKVCEYYSKTQPADAFVVSDSIDLLKYAKTQNSQLLCVLDGSAKDIQSNDDLIALREDANCADARIIILPLSAATINNVEYLQKLLMTVWTECPENTDVNIIKAATAGVCGIIGHSDIVTKFKAVSDKYFIEGSMLRMPNIVGHRGVLSLAQENTVAGSIKAVELGATIIENDVYLTKDGVAVIMHDSTIDRTTNGTGNVVDFTYAQLSQYVVDSNTTCDTEPIPKLEDYFIAFKDQDVALFVEIKQNSVGVVAEVVRLIKQYDIADQVNIVSFNYNQLLEFKELMPEMSVGYITSSISVSENDYLNDLETVLFKTIQYQSTYNPSYAKGPLGYSFLNAALQRGVVVLPWTIDNQATLDKYFIYGTFGMTTNYTQYLTDYTKYLNVQNSYEFIAGNEFNPKITSTSYSRVAQDASAEMILIDGNSTIKYENGVLSATESGTATVMFRQSAKTSSGDAYYIYSQPVLLNITAKNGDTTTISNGTTAIIDNTTAATSEGCNCNSSAIALLPILLTASISIFIFKRKK